METNVKTDAQLVKRIQKGDHRAFEEFYARYEKPLYNHIYRYLKNGEEAEEVFHDTLCKVLNFKNFEFTGDSLRGWLYLTARNQSLNHLRKRKRGYKVHGILQKEEPEYETQETEQIKKEYHEQLLAMSEQLPKAQRQVLELKLSGKSHKEISDELSIPEGTVKSRFHSITQFLKKGFSI